MTVAIVGEFSSAGALLRGIAELRRRGYRALDAFTPYPVHGLEEALGLARSRIPWLVLLMAFGGAATAFAIQAWTNAIDYPLNAGGRPPFAPPAFVPITFEMGVLAAAFTALFALFRSAGLPRLAHPVFDVPGFERASIDRFFLEVSAADPLFDEADVRSDLEAAGAANLAAVEGGR